MKKIFLLLPGFLCVSGCFNGERYPTSWSPDPYHIHVDCCVTSDQVQGAIRMALLKRKWKVLDIDSSNVYAHLSCRGTETDVVFSTTDKYYDVRFENVKEAEYNDHDCIYDHMKSLNKIIGKYVKKISIKNAKLELKAAKKEQGN